MPSSLHQVNTIGLLIPEPPPSLGPTYLENSLMSGMLLEFYQAVENDQLHVVVALLDDQINVALGCSLKPNTKG